MSEAPERQKRWWRFAYYVLFVAWIGCALLVMNRVRAGFITNYGADLTQPAWLYIVCRDLHESGRLTMLTHLVGSRPETAAIVIFLGGLVTEVSQRYWPSGIFGGRFDPYDIVAYATGISVCYVFDKHYTARRSN
jgi:hypothetical protein